MAALLFEMAFTLGKTNSQAVRLASKAKPMLSIWIGICITRIISMPLRAVCFVSVFFARISPSHILKMRYRFQVKRIDADLYSTKMIEFQSLRDLTNMQCVRHNMCQMANDGPGLSDLSISIPQTSNPKPTTRIGFGQALLQQSVDQRAWLWPLHLLMIPQLRNLGAV